MPITSFAGRNAFVTGGASGIGLCIVRALAKRDAFVIIADQRADRLGKALKTVAAEGLGESVIALELDVTDRKAYAEAARRIDEELGGIDILVNNADVDLERSPLEATQADWEFVFGINLGGVVNGLQLVLPQMIAHGRGGHVVNTASLAATVAVPDHHAIYAASKAAVLNLTENMRADLAAKGIGSSALCTGLSRPELEESGRKRVVQRPSSNGANAFENTHAKRALRPDGTAPDLVGELVADAILADRLYVIAHDDHRVSNHAKTHATALQHRTGASRQPEPDGRVRSHR